jgi:hypothetical protein
VRFDTVISAISTSTGSGICISGVWYVLEALFEGSVAHLDLWRAGNHRHHDKNIN